MNEKDNESKLKRFIKDAFTSEAKVSRIPYYFFGICVLLTVICVQLNIANRYLKRIAAGGLGTYSFEIDSKSNDPNEVFVEKTDESETETVSENKPSESNTVSESKSDSTTTTTTKPQTSVRTYVINTSSKKIHYPSCSYASNIKDENKLTVNLTQDELKSQYLSNGYVFCSKCG